MSGKLDYSFLEIKEKIEAWCAYRDRCHSEVRKKLKDLGADQEDTYALTAHLVENRFLDEQRFADSYISGKHKIKKWGRNKIVQQLKAKQVHENCIKSALKTIDENLYLENLKDLAERKWKEKSGTIFQKKQKVTRYLYQKGYEFDLINFILEELSEEDANR